MIKVSSGVQIDILILFLKYEIYLNAFVQNLASIKPGFKYLPILGEPGKVRELENDPQKSWKTVEH